MSYEDDSLQTIAPQAGPVSSQEANNYGDDSLETLAPGVKPQQSLVDDDLVTVAPTAKQMFGGQLRRGELILNRYEILSVLGEGGMGLVYKCFDRISGVEVAVKVLSSKLTHSPEAMRALRDNFQLITSLIHENIASNKNLDYDPKSNEYFIIMECVQGEDLYGWLKRKKVSGELAPQDVVKILRQVADALDYAHREGVIHRDIKPSNIMIRVGDRVKLLDFGLATQEKHGYAYAEAESGEVCGTGPYMAPEQWLGKAQDNSIDQYALAVVAFEMLTGKLPFYSKDMAKLKELVLEGKLAKPEKMSQKVFDVLLTALSHDNSKRYPTCKEFVEQLNISLNGIKLKKQDEEEDVTGKGQGSEAYLVRTRVQSKYKEIVGLHLDPGQTFDVHLRSLKDNFESGKAAFKNKSYDAAYGCFLRADKEIAWLEESQSRRELFLAKSEEIQARISEWRQHSLGTDSQANIEELVKQLDMAKSQFEYGQFAEALSLQEKAKVLCDELLLEFAGDDFESKKIRAFQALRDRQWNTLLELSSDLLKDSPDELSFQRLHRIATGRIGQMRARAARTFAKTAIWLGCIVFVIYLLVHFGPGVWHWTCYRYNYCRRYIVDSLAIQKNGLSISLPKGTSLLLMKVEPCGKKTNSEYHFENQDYWLGMYEVSVSQYQAVMGALPNGNSQQEAQKAVIGVTYENAREFCRRLNQDDSIARPSGYAFDLPTEGQWQNAAVGKEGSAQTRFSGTDLLSGIVCSDNHAEDREENSSVSWIPNDYGLYAMSGNVAEWCLCSSVPINQDCGLVLGGSWQTPAKACQLSAVKEAVSKRMSEKAGRSVKDVGFRVALVPKVSSKEIASLQNSGSDDKNSAKIGSDFKVNAQGGTFGMVWLNAGFLADDREECHAEIKHGFWISNIEVTCQLWGEIMQGTLENQVSKMLADTHEYSCLNFQTISHYWNASDAASPAMHIGPSSPNTPMYYVSWNEAVEFCAKLTERERAAHRLPTGYAYSLPTVSQWQYAYWGGDRFNSNVEHRGFLNSAWHRENSQLSSGPGWKLVDSGEVCGPHEVSRKDPNDALIYDMGGNVAEWCLDIPHYYVSLMGENARCWAGGSWSSSEQKFGASKLAVELSSFRGDFLGFRVVLVPAP